MTTFIDGPAKEQCLMLRRSPVLMRVTEEILPESGKHKWDALNELTDRPLPHERLYAYTMAEFRGSAFIVSSKFHGRVNLVSYKLTKTQPTDAEMRDEMLWHNWCVANDPR
jgi:hypothetical protein